MIVPFISAKLCLDSGYQLQRIKRLGNVVVRADGKSQDLVCVLGPGSQHDDRIKMFLTDLLAEFVAVNIRKHDVQDRQGEIFLFDTIQGILSVITFQNFHPFVGKIDFNQISDGLFVVHD